MAVGVFERATTLAFVSCLALVACSGDVEDEAVSATAACADETGDLTVDGNVATDRAGLDVTNVTLTREGDTVVAEIAVAGAPSTAIEGATDSAIWYVEVTPDPSEVGFVVQAGMSSGAPSRETFEVLDQTSIEYSDTAGTFSADGAQLELPADLVEQLGESFFWRAGAEGNPEDGRQYQDACPGPGGLPEDFLRFGNT